MTDEGVVEGRAADGLAGAEPDAPVRGTDAPSSEGRGTRRGPVRRLYDWVLHWADTPYGPAALFALALAESSFFPIPPDPLLIALCLGAASRSLRFAAIATVASVVGGVIGYGIGALFWEVTQDLFFNYVPNISPEAFASIQGMYDEWGFWWVFAAGFTFIPYKLITISAGVFSINFGAFLIASILSRGMRFFLVAWLIKRFGPSIASFIDRYFDLLAIAFAVLLVGGFLLIEFAL